MAQIGALVSKYRDGTPKLSSPGTIEFEAPVEVSLDPYHDALPWHVFQAYTHGPAVAPIGEFSNSLFVRLIARALSLAPAQPPLA